MSVLVSKAIVDVQRHLYAHTRPVLNNLTIAAVTSDTQLILSAGTVTNAEIQIGSLLAVDRELMRVTDNIAAPTSQIVTVLRACSGTTAASHAAAVDVEVNPRFARPHIVDALLDEINSWQPDLYRVASTTYSVASFPYTVDVGTSYADAYGPISARVMNTSAASTTNWPQTTPTLLTGMATTDYASGTAIYFQPPSSGPATPASVHVTFALPFVTTAFTDAIDLVGTVGLATSMVDVAVLGAVIRLLTSREVPRTDPTAQGQPRDAAEVQSGAQLQVASGLRQLYRARLDDERRKLSARYPIRFG